MNKMKKTLMLLLFSAVLLTGCSSRGNVNEKAYLRAAAVDGDSVTLVFFNEDEGTVTVPLSDPEKAKPAAELAIGKEIFTGHTEIVLLGDCDREEVLKHILKKWRVSPSCMAVEAEGKGEIILKARNPKQLTGIIEQAQEKDLAPKCDIITVLSRLLDGEPEEMPLLSVYGLESEK